MAGPCEEYGYDAVGEGWHHILEALDIMMVNGVNHAQNNANGTVREEFRDKECEEDASINILQIKEKFGCLRVYWQGKGLGSSIDQELRGAAYMAETLSFKVCEQCGSIKEVETRARKNQKMGWVKNYCAKCHEENDKKT